MTIYIVCEKIDNVDNPIIVTIKERELDAIIAMSENALEYEKRFLDCGCKPKVTVTSENKATIHIDANIGDISRKISVSYIEYEIPDDIFM